MNVLLTVLGGVAWVLSQLGLALLVLLAVVLALALLALLIPFCADVAWEGEEGSPDGLGRLRVRAGALGLTVPVFEYPKPVPPPAPEGQEPARPGLFRRLLARLKAKLADRREARRQKRAAKAAARRPKAPAKPREKAKFTLDPGRLWGAARDPHPAVLAGERGRAGRGRPGLRPGQRMALPHAGGAEPLYLPGL